MNDDIDPELKSTLKWMKKTSEVKTPAGLETRILAKLDEQQRQKSRRPWIWGFSGGLATALVATLVVISTRELPQKHLERMALPSAPVSQLANRAIAKDTAINERADNGVAALRGAGAGIQEMKALKRENNKVVRTPDEWEMMWNAAPAVDFSTQMVIAVFDGKIVSHKIENGKLVVQYRRENFSVTNRPTDWLVVPVFDGLVEFIPTHE